MILKLKKKQKQNCFLKKQNTIEINSVFVRRCTLKASPLLVFCYLDWWFTLCHGPNQAFFNAKKKRMLKIKKKMATTINKPNKKISPSQPESICQTRDLAHENEITLQRRKEKK